MDIQILQQNWLAYGKQLERQCFCNENAIKTIIGQKQKRYSRQLSFRYIVSTVLYGLFLIALLLLLKACIGQCLSMILFSLTLLTTVISFGWNIFSLIEWHRNNLPFQPFSAFVKQFDKIQRNDKRKLLFNYFVELPVFFICIPILSVYIERYYTGNVSGVLSSTITWIIIVGTALFAYLQFSKYAVGKTFKDIKNLTAEIKEVERMEK